jgi:hypothetical protein
VTTMSWFRSRSKWGSYLALFALAFQLAISFGHVHLDGGASASARSALLAVHPSTISNASVDPAGKEAPALADEYCPICALIQLARALVPAEAPPVLLPTLFGQLRYEAAVAFELTASRPTLFRARAPPAA